MEHPNKWCFAWYVNRKSVTGKDRAALIKGAQWTSGDIITVSFLDGDLTLQKKVKEIALQWTAPGLANLVLDFRKDTNTLIRLSFRHSGSWSAIGTTCRQITDRSRPTMNYGWLDATSSMDEIQCVVLHEFGHALGLVHEHQNPNNEIDWNREAVIQDLSGPPNNWSLEVIEQNIFEPFSRLETNFTVLDPSSIMMYPVPASWTKDGFSVGLNCTLSTVDKAFIREQYP